MTRYEFQLRSSAEQYLDYYRGTVRHVTARCTTRKTVQFPASLLQQFVTTEGMAAGFHQAAAWRLQVRLLWQESEREGTARAGERGVCAVCEGRGISDLATSAP